MKAMKKTLSCILALTLTASMMAESLSAFAEYDNSSSIGEDFDEMPDIATTPFVLGENQVIQKVSISAPKYTVYSDAESLNLDDVIVTIQYQEVAGETFDSTGTAQTYKLSGQPKYYYGRLSAFTRLADKAVPTASNLKSGYYTLTAFTNDLQAANGFDKLDAADLTAVVPTLYFANNLIDTSTGEFTKAGSSVDPAAANTASGVDGTHAVIVNDAANEKIGVVTAVITGLKANLEEGATYYKGQKVGEAFKNATFSAVYNSGTVDKRKALTISEVKWKHSGDSVWTDLTTDTLKLGEDSEDTIIFTNKAIYADKATEVLQVSVNVLLTSDAVSTLAYYDGYTAEKTYKKGQPVELGSAIIEVTKETGDKDYLVSRNNAGVITWYKVGSDELTDLKALQTAIINGTDSDTEWDAVDKTELTLVESADKATAKGQYYIDFDNETVGTGKTATLTYMGKSLVLGTDFAVEDSKVTAVAIGMTDNADQLKAAIEAGRIVNTGTAEIPAYKFYFAPGETPAFTEGDAWYQLTFADGGVSQKYDLATNISKFTIAEGQTVADATKLTLVYSGEDVAETAVANDLTKQLNIKVENKNYSVEIDKSKATAPAFIKDAKDHDFSGIKVTVKNPTTGVKIVDGMDLAEIAADTTGKWKVYFADDGIAKATTTGKAYAFNHAAADTWQGKARDKIAGHEIDAGDIVVAYVVNGEYFAVKESLSVVADYITGISIKKGVDVDTYYVPNSKLFKEADYGTGDYATTSKVKEPTASSVKDTDIKGLTLEFTTKLGKTDTVTINSMDGQEASYVVDATNNSVLKTAAAAKACFTFEKPSRFSIGDNVYTITFIAPTTNKEMTESFSLTGKELKPVSIAAVTSDDEAENIKTAEALRKVDDPSDASIRTAAIPDFSHPKKASGTYQKTDFLANNTASYFVVTWNNGMKSYAADGEIDITAVDATSVANDKKATITFEIADYTVSTDVTVEITQGDVSGFGATATHKDKDDNTTGTFTIANDKLTFVVGDTALTPYKIGANTLKTGDKFVVTVNYGGGADPDTFDLLNADDLKKFTVKTNIDTSEVATGKDLVLTYGGKDLTLKYDVVKATNTFTLSSKPTKTTYKSGELPDFTGGVLKMTTTGQLGGSVEYKLEDIAAGKVTGFKFEQDLTKELTANKQYTIEYNNTTIENIIYTVVSNPVDEDLDTYYEKNGDEYVKTGDNAIVIAKTYYTASNAITIDFTVADAFVTGLTKDGEIDDSKYFQTDAGDKIKPNFGDTKVKFASTDEDGEFVLNSIAVKDLAGDLVEFTPAFTGSTDGFYGKTYMTITYVDPADKKTKSDPYFAVAGEHTITIYSFDQKIEYTVDVQKIVATDVIFGLADKSVKVTDATAIAGGTNATGRKGDYIQEFKQDTTAAVYEGDDVSKIKFADSANADTSTGMAGGSILIKYNNGDEVIVPVLSGVIGNNDTIDAIKDIPGHGDNTVSVKVTCDMSTAGDAVPATITFTDGDTVIAKTFNVKIAADSIPADNVEWTFSAYKGEDDDLPDAEAETLGQIYKYTGTTDSDFTHDKFYRCVETSTPGYAWQEYEYSDTTLTVPVGATSLTDTVKGAVVIEAETANGAKLTYDLSTAAGLKKVKITGFDTTTATNTASGETRAVKVEFLAADGTTIISKTFTMKVVKDTATIVPDAKNPTPSYSSADTAPDFSKFKFTVKVDDKTIETKTVAEAIADNNHYVVSIAKGLDPTQKDDIAIADVHEASDEDIAKLFNTTTTYYIRVSYVSETAESAVIHGTGNALDVYNHEYGGIGTQVGSFEVKAKASFVKSIDKVSTAPAVVAWDQGEDPDTIKGVFETSAVVYDVTFANGVTGTVLGNGGVTADVSNVDVNTPGKYKVKITKDDGSIEYEIEIKEKEIKSVELIAKGSAAGDFKAVPGANDVRNVYAVGQTADYTNLVFKVTFKDSTTTEINVKDELKKGDKSVISVSGFNSTKPAVDQKITITYAGKTATYKVQIEEVTAVKAIKFKENKTPTKTSYKPSEEPTLAGAEFTVSVKTESITTPVNVEADAEDFSEVEFTTPTANQSTLTIKKYLDIDIDTDEDGTPDGAEVTKSDSSAFNVTISQNAIKKIAISEEPTTTYWLGTDVKDADTFDIETGKITVTYADPDVPADVISFSDTRRVRFYRNNVQITDFANAISSLTKGKYEIVVKYDETGAFTNADAIKTIPYTIEVKEDKVTAIEVTDLQRTEYLSTEKFDPTGAKVKFTLESGREAEEIALTDAMFTVSELDGSKLGEQEITVTYTGDDDNKVETKVKVTVVENLVDKIAIVDGTDDLQLLYTTADEKLDLTGVQLEVTYKAELADGTNKQTIDLAAAIKSGDATVSDADFTKTGVDQELTVTYKDKTCILKIRVTKLIIKEIVNSTKDPIATTVKKGTTLEEFRKSGSITVNYIAGDRTKEVPLTSDKITITGFDASKEVASQKLTINYAEADQNAKLEVTIEVSDKTIVSIQAAVGKAQKEFKVGDTFTAKDATVVVTYAEGDGDPETFQLPNDLFTVTAPDMTKANSAAVVTVALKSDPTIKSTYTVKIVGEAADSEIGEEVKGVTEPTDVVNALPTDYELTKNPVALFEETVSDDTTSYKYVAGYETLDAMFEKGTVLGTSKTATGKYVILISGEQTPTKKITLPSKATAIKFIGADENAKLNLGKLTTINVKTAAIEIDVPVTASKNVAITVGKGQKLIIGEQAKGSVFGAIKGDKATSTVDFNSDVTVASIANFKSVNTAPGHKTTLAAKGSIKTVGTLSGHYVFPSDATASAISVTKAEFDIMQGTKQGKITLDNVTAEDEDSVGLLVKVLDSNNELVELSNGTPILYTKDNDAKFTKSITIANNDGALSAVSYKKELRAEDETLLTVGEKTYSSFEKLFSEITTGDVVIEMNASATMSKATKINKNITSITIKGGSDVVLTTEVTAIKAPKITLEDLTIKSTKALTITASGAEVNLKNVKFEVKANGMTIAGNKKATVLTIEDVTGIDKLQNFLDVKVKGQVSVTKTVAIEALTLDDGTIVFGKDAGVKIGTLSGSGTIGIVAPSKKFKTISITKASGEEGDIKVAEYKLEALDDGSPIYVLVSAPTIAEGTLIFTSKDKTLDTKLFDADALGGELVNDGKGKITLKKSS